MNILDIALAILIASPGIAIIGFIIILAIFFFKD